MKRAVVLKMANKKRGLAILLGALGILLVSCFSCHDDGGSRQQESTQTHFYEVKADGDELTLAELGYPSHKDGILLKRKAYVASYNTENLIPNWVAWELTAEHADGPWPRDNHYYEDISVPNPRCTAEDYRGIGKIGLSKGHMCPAGDCKWDSVAMSETNLLTNICPQERGLNSGMWNQVEQSCRRWAVKYGHIYIVCGPLLFRQEHLKIGDHNVVVPEAFFKVILRLGNKPACIGYVMRNGARGKKNSYVNSLSQVERITGYRFFPNLNDSVRSKIENVVDEAMW